MEIKVLWAVSSVGKGHIMRDLAIINQLNQLIKVQIDYPDAYFIITSPKTGAKNWIHYHQFLDNLYQYFIASDFVITQSGYGKVVELATLGTPFIAIPLEYHFEQEYFMMHRLERYGFGKVVTIRNHTPKSIAKIVHELMNKKPVSIKADTGKEIADIIFKMINQN